MSGDGTHQRQTGMLGGEQADDLHLPGSPERSSGEVEVPDPGPVPGRTPRQRQVSVNISRDTDLTDREEGDQRHFRDQPARVRNDSYARRQPLVDLDA